MSGTTTNYGWTYPTSTDYVKDGATAIQTVATGVDTTLGTALNNKLHAGLVLVKTQTIGTGVSSVTVTGAFNSTYDNYKIMITGTVGSTSSEVTLSLGGSTSGYYGAGAYIPYGGTATVAGFNNSGAYWQGAGHFSTNGCSVNIELTDPYASKVTSYRTLGTVVNTAGSSVMVSGFLNNTTSHTAFTFTTTTGTITGGTIAVYGYAKD